MRQSTGVPFLSRWGGVLAAGLLLSWVPGWGAEGEPQNLAPKARITATSEYSGGYLAKFVADGKIPEAGGHQDVGEAWCVNGATHRNGADLIFEWDEPVTIAQVVYYARLAWQWEEAWKGYQVLGDDSPTPVVTGELEVTADGQRVTLPAPVKVRKLTLRFTSSHGGSNPGASGGGSLRRRFPRRRPRRSLSSSGSCWRVPRIATRLGRWAQPCAVRTSTRPSTRPGRCSAWARRHARRCRR